MLSGQISNKIARRNIPNLDCFIQASTEQSDIILE